jgi:two-component system, LytTR family, response regulator
MAKLRTLIVDDERLARLKLRRFLEEQPDVEIVGECGSGAEAVERIRAEQPDLLFLDIQMPGLDGFAVLREVGSERRGRVVFVTAHDEHAVRAFEVEALDYLLKPFDRARFQQTLDRVRRERRQTLDEKIAGLLERIEKPATEESLDRILVRSGGRMTFLKLCDVDWIEADDNDLRFHAGRATHLVRDTLRRLEPRLDPRLFLRIHRSAIVNIEAIAEIRSLFHGDYDVLLRDGTALPVGRTYRDRLLQRMGDTRT